MLNLEDKLQLSFDYAKLGKKVNVELEVEELSLLLALVKGDNAYTKALGDNLLQLFEK